MRLLPAILAAILLSAPAFAQKVATTSSAIVAVINDEAITYYDLDARVRFVLATTNISPDASAVARLKPQILRSMVDEKLQLQEGRRAGLTLSEKEVEQAIAAIEGQRGITPGGIGIMLASNRIPEDTFIQQVKAQLVWSKLLQRKVRSQIKMDDEEIARMAKKLAAPVIRQELKIALLQLPVDKPARDEEVRNAAEKLVLEVRGGADFEELARQFAGGANREGGKLSTFWVRPDDLDPSIGKALSRAKAGDISTPLRNSIGYTIIKVYETRDLPGQEQSGTEIVFREIMLKLRSSADKAQEGGLAEVAERIAKNPGTCEENDIPSEVDKGVASVEVKKTTQMLVDLPAGLRVIAESLKPSEISTPLASEEGIHLYQLCSKREGVSAPVDNERAKAAVYQQRMELEAQKYMRNLRRDAFIDVRG